MHRTQVGLGFRARLILCNVIFHRCIDMSTDESLFTEGAFIIAISLFVEVIFEVYILMIYIVVAHCIHFGGGLLIGTL